MTNIEQKALELVNEVSGSGSWTLTSLSHPYNRVVFTALCRSIEQREAFAQEVSDALEKRGFYIDDRDLGRFIITKPDPLVDVIKDAWPEASKAYGEDNVVETAETLRAALAKRGGRIVFDDM